MKNFRGFLAFLVLIMSSVGLVAQETTKPLDQINAGFSADVAVGPERLMEITLLTNPSLEFGSVFTEEQSDYQAVIISNTGDVDLNINSLHFQGDPLHFALLYEEPDMILAPSETDTVLVLFMPQAMGTLSDTLYIDNTSVNEPVIQISLSGTGVAVAPQAPQNLLIDKSDNNILLSWDAVTQNMHGQLVSPDFYFVYIAGDPLLPYAYHGMTILPNYVYAHVDLGDPRLFYKVTAVKLYRDAETNTWLSRNLRQGMSEEQVAKLLRTLPNSH